jgi:NTP pyrophosphatase (non-canonical NTP hydrolase)
MMTTAEQLQFKLAFEVLQKDAADINAASGFVNTDARAEQLQKYLESVLPNDTYQYYKPLFPMFKNSRIGLKLLLIVTELGELFEGVRKEKAEAPDDHIPEFTYEEAEMADVVIRAMNYSTDRKLRLGAAILAKNEFNRHREDHKPENRALDGGKKF